MKTSLVKYLRSLWPAKISETAQVPQPPDAKIKLGDNIRGFHPHPNFKGWDPIIEKGWREGVDFQALLADKRVLILGDTHHDFLGIQRGFIEHLSELREAGATHLGMETDADITRETFDVYAEKTYIPHRLRQLVYESPQNGLGVIFIDMPKAEIASTWSEDETSRNRGIYMGLAIADFLLKNPDAKMVAIVGYAHIKDHDQIPAQLDQYQIPYRLVGVVSEGQRWQESAGFPMPVVSAIATASSKENRYGYVDLSSFNFDIDGIIHFPFPKPEAPSARPLPKDRFLQEIELSQPQKLSMILKDQFKEGPEVKEDQITKPLYINFEDRVDPNVHTWQQTNENKIIEFVSQLEGITNGQKLYLVSLLLSYARNTGRHSLNGSIVKMGFVPNGQFFEIVTVDCCHYPYNPKKDYGSLMSPREISLKTLQDRFGYKEFFSKDLKDLPEIEIGINPENPSALFGFVALVLAAITHPERIEVRGGRLYIYYTDVETERDLNAHFRHGPVLTELFVQDFILNDTEQLLMQAKALGQDQHTCFLSFGYGKNALYDLIKESRLSFIKRRRAEKLLEALKDIHLSYKGVHSEKIDALILGARKELRYLNQDEIDQALELLNQSIESATRGLGLIEEFFKRYPESASRIIDRETSLQALFDQLKELVNRLNEIKLKISSLQGNGVLLGENRKE